MEASFSEILRALRGRARLSQEELAERSGLSVQAVGSLERGSRRAPYRRTIESLASALGADMWELDGLLKAAARARRRDKGAVLPAAFERTSNLPSQITSFVGRDPAVMELVALLDRRRLVTVTGIGGVGKTRLAVVAGSHALERYEDGARFVDLSSLADPSDVTQRFLSALAITATSADVVATLVAELRTRQLLLVVDNCEHVLEPAAGLIATILSSCPGVDILATSRHRLSLTGECVYRLEPLDTASAVDLFAQRACDADRNFTIADANRPRIAAICCDLDGIPLAIEIAAARIASLDLDSLQAKVRNGRTEISGGFRDIAERHETLTATLRWSYELLNDRERAVLRRLSVFAGGCCADAARAVCTGSSVKIDEVDDALSALVDTSLVSVESEPAGRRFRLLETTREYCLAILRACGEETTAVDRHTRWVESFSRDARNPSIFSDHADRIARVAREYDNVTTAIHRAIETDRDVPLAASIFGNLDWYWGPIWRWEESTQLADALLGRLDSDRDPEIAARLLLAKSRGLIGIERLRVVQKATELFSATHNDAALSSCYQNLAYTFEMLGESAKMLSAIGWAWTFTMRAGIDASAGAIAVLYFRAQAMEIAGRRREARKLFAEALTLCKSTERTFYQEPCLYNLASLDAADGQIDSALATFEQLFSMPTATVSAKWVYTRIAGCHILKNDVVAAALAVQAALLVPEELSLGNLCALERAAHVAALSGNVLWAGRAFRYVESRFHEYGCKRNMLDLVCYENLQMLLYDESADTSSIGSWQGPHDDRSAIDEAFTVLDAILNEFASPGVMRS
jgi:predicted ATPase/transcriptional regulator with XRE-family HTH domain